MIQTVKLHTVVNFQAPWYNNHLQIPTINAIQTKCNLKGKGRLSVNGLEGTTIESFLFILITHP